MLGFNKQLDFQTLLTSLGRKIAREQGWYHIRREVQAAFVMAMAVCGIIVMFLIFRGLKGMFRKNWLVYVGLVVLFGFLLLRAATFYHVETLLHKPDIFKRLDVKFIIELGALISVGLGALQSLYHAKSKMDVNS